MNQDKHILLTVDVEDWFQVENFKPWIPFSSWDSYELRVEKNTHRLLDLLDSFESAGKPEGRSRKAKSTQQWGPMDSRATDNELRTTSHGHSEAVSIQPPSLPASRLSGHSRPKATFFILGWIAERLPHLVREIHARGHEVASHGINHHLCNKLAKKDLKNDLADSKKLLENIIGDRVYGYRAPSFSVTNDILKIIEDGGYLYDSSFNSFNLHGRYGKLSMDGYPKKGIASQVSKGFYEFPLSNLKFLPRKIHDSDSETYLTGATNQTNPSNSSNPKNFYELPISNFKFGNISFPFGGGAYFRLIPFILFKTGVRKILKKENAFLFYLHPWEIDPEQPKVKNAFLTYKFRHYNNLKKTYSKLSNLIKNFQHFEFVTCSQYLNSVTPFG